MAPATTARPQELAAVDEFLDTAARTPSALLIEGEPGIGKTTLWLAAQHRAEGRDFLVLATRATAAESSPAYTALADLLSRIEPPAWADLPEPQRAAIDQITLRATVPATDQRAVAAAFLSTVERLADDRPVLLAIDDLQWLDPSSMRAIAFAARRWHGPVGLVATVRTDAVGGDVSAWLQLRRPADVTRITLRPLPSRALHTVVAENLQRPLSRATMTRVHQVSGGNPFYAIELARVLADDAEMTLPGSLAELVRTRLGNLDPATHEVLLAAAALATPTVERVTAAVAHDGAVGLLETAEQHGVVVIEGNRIRFTHPLLAAGVYADATPEQRRSAHRRLADVVAEPEARARHLALAATTADPHTLAALDGAAASAADRGAPAAAAELLDIAIELGGDTPERRIRLASHTFDAGDPARARALLERVIADLPPGQLRAHASHTLAVVRFIDDGYPDAARLLQRALDEDDPDGPLHVQMSTALAYALYMTGEPEAAWHRAHDAVAQAERLSDPALLSQALGVRATLQFFGGGGIDEPSLRRALEYEDHDAFIPTMLRPSVEHALILCCTGDLDTSYDLLRAISRRCVDRGEEGEVVFVDFYVVVNRIWRADFGEAKSLAKDVTELARQLGGEFPAMLSSVLRAWLAVYDGDDEAARPAVADAIDASKLSGTAWHEDWSMTALGLLEVSLGNHEAAVNALQPLWSRFAPNSTEIHVAAFVPDLVEALVGLGRAAEAEPLVDALERNGQRLDRPWMLAVGARGRAMVLAARGDLRAAVASAERAMDHHQRLPMPFERARTELLLGELLRRQRKPDSSTVLRAAVQTFEELHTPLWAGRARAQLDAGEPAAQGRLSAAERQVAELAATGMTNRDVAGALFISTKTVEATLARVYRKLGIRSRAELGSLMGQPRSHSQ